MSKSPASDRVLTITLTEGVDEGVGRALAGQLGQFVPVAEPQVYERKAADPEIPQFIQLIGSIETWRLLAYAAGAVVGTRLLQHVTDDLWALLKTRLGHADAKPIAELSATPHTPDRHQLHLRRDRCA